MVEYDKSLSYGGRNEKQVMCASPELLDYLKEFNGIEAKSCLMDFGCVTPLYVYRMWGGTVSYNEIEKALDYLKANNYGYRRKTV